MTQKHMRELTDKDQVGEKVTFYALGWKNGKITTGRKMTGVIQQLRYDHLQEHWVGYVQTIYGTYIIDVVVNEK